MANYQTDELSFTLPDGWVDESVHLFAKPEGALSINVTRVELKGEKIRAYVMAQLKALTRAMQGFHVIGQRALKVAEVEAYEARIQWAPKGTLCYQHQVYISYYETALVFTASGPKNLAAQCDAYLEKSLAKIKFRKRRP